MADSLHVEILKSIATLMTTAFAFVAGLAWNGAIQELIGLFLDKGSAVTGLLIYAVVVTIVAVVVTVFIARLLARQGIELDN